MKSSTILPLGCAIALGALTFGCCEPLPCKTPTTTPVAQPIPPPEETPADRPPMTVIGLREPGTGTVSFRFSFTAGSSQDAADKHGQALISAWLMAEGGTKDLSSAQLKERLFPMSAGIGFSVDKDQSVFYGRVLSSDAAAYYELLAGVLLHPAMAQGDFERIRGQVKDALVSDLRGSDDEELGKAALDLAMYKGHPYASPVLGARGDLEKLTLDDVRDWRERHLCRDRLTIGVSGEITDELVAKVRADMEQLPSERCELAPSLPGVAPAAGRQVLIVDKPQASATAISIGFPIDVRRGDPDYAALKLVEAYFGQHRTFMGRLQKRLRVERGLNYGNYAYAEHFEQDGGEQVPAVNVSRHQQDFTLWLRPVKDADRHFALRLALMELSNLVEKGLSKQQLDETRTFMKSYYPSFAQTQERRLGYAIDAQFYAKPGEQPPEHISALLSAIDALTLDAVNAAIRKHLQTDNVFIALVGKDAKALSEALASDAPSPIVYASPKSADITAEDAKVSKMPLRIDKQAITVVPAAKIFE